jgi:hypothetical protein
MTQPSAIRSRVINDVATALQRVNGMTHAQALEAAQGAADKAYERASQHNNEPFFEGAGDRALAEQSTDPTLRAFIDGRLSKGITTDDFRWWWNMCPFEQQMLLASYEIHRMALFMFLREKGHDPKQAGTMIFQFNAKFDDFPSDDTSDDRPLPVELMHRLVEYTERQGGGSIIDVRAITQQSFDAIKRAGEPLRAKITQHSTFNAFVRAEMRAGRL